MSGEFGKIQKVAATLHPVAGLPPFKDRRKDGSLAAQKVIKPVGIAIGYGGSHRHYIRFEGLIIHFPEFRSGEVHP